MIEKVSSVILQCKSCHRLYPMTATQRFIGLYVNCKCCESCNGDLTIKNDAPKPLESEFVTEV